MSDKIFKLIDQEIQRQKSGLEMIPSENYVSKDVLRALGSILTDKYSEGYPGARYYGGNEVIDQIENYAKELANKLFFTAAAIVQPYSGSPANFAVMLGLLQPGDTIMGMSLQAGGHLTHGTPVSFSGKLFNSVQYGVDPTSGRINYDEVRELVLQHKPKLIWVGLTAYPYLINYSIFSKIAKEVGAYLVADVSHLAGLLVAGVFDSPAAYVDVITTTTHKTLRGPRGAMILITDKGLEKDPELTSKLEKAVFPGLQGGPHNNTTAAIAVALEEASSTEFKEYAKQILKNAQSLAESLIANGLKLVGGGTENHLMLIDLSTHGFGMGYQAQVVLEAAGVTVNKNTIPADPASPFYPSGVRLGTPALTSRGMKEEDMRLVANWISKALEEIKGHDLPKEQPQRQQFIKDFKVWAKQNQNLARIKKEVKDFATKFPLPGVE